jgi:hypothetical protein
MSAYARTQGTLAVFAAGSVCPLEWLCTGDRISGATA